MAYSDQAERTIRAERVLCSDGRIRPAELVIQGGVISSCREIAAGGRDGLLLLPGIVDLHGDAFERQLLPRAGVRMPSFIGLVENDRQLISNGITTAFYGLTSSWEPGLRGTASALEFIGEFNRVKPRLQADSRLHLRFEIFSLDGVKPAIEWMQRGWVDLLAFNDHTDFIRNRIASKPEAINRYIDRTSLRGEDYLALLQSVRDRKEEVAGGVRRVAAAAREHSIPMASHDDETPEMRRGYHVLGCEISEFPMDRATAEAAAELGNSIALGAPNVIRGRSHAGRLTAAEAIAAGLGNILCSDYYYPALLAAPFHLANSGVLDLADAWNLASRNPAIAAGLSDRGIIAEGKRADLVLVDDRDALHPRVVAVFAGGRVAFAQESNAVQFAIHPFMSAPSVA